MAVAMMGTLDMARSVGHAQELRLEKDAFPGISAGSFAKQCPHCFRLLYSVEGGSENIGGWGGPSDQA